MDAQPTIESGSPQGVAVRWLEALSAGDLEAAEALSAPGLVPEEERDAYLAQDLVLVGLRPETLTVGRYEQLVVFSTGDTAPHGSFVLRLRWHAGRGWLVAHGAARALEELSHRV